ncbi:NO-inducible flavohemoprotein [Limimaricola litoreus]|uniref:nitric oxide dioxygenase n=1 Tax=Limimaricola litoreus TaxID=2955316 RepID=A0A9X2JMU9_9RHOB|nr:NO-inducible flavohemoprotein [Limimaricola litoreus]MCP1167757.1 NO-inducible flavohemoprotein [Limimaricola litoreus]
MPTALSPRTVALVKASVPALEAHGPAITEAMYRRLFRDPQIAALFNHANQRSGAQRFALANAVLAYARHIENPAALGAAIERIAQKHVGYAILPEHYPHVAGALLGAMEDILGEAATPELLAAWGQAYWFLAEILQARETEIREANEVQPGSWTGWRRFVVAERHSESDAITSFILRPEDDGPVVPHRAGQYLTLRFDAAGLEGAKRNYSISCGANATHYRITVKREHDGEVSGFLHDRAVEGTVLEATAPAGDFYLAERPDRPVLLLSGGVGLTPMVSMLEVIADRHPKLPTWYIHATTDRANHALGAHVHALAKRHGQVSTATFYDDHVTGSDAMRGRITVDWLRENTPLQEAEIYLCGPKPFMRSLITGLLQDGIPVDRIHYEIFGPGDEDLAA